VTKLVFVKTHKTASRLRAGLLAYVSSVPVLRFSCMMRCKFCADRLGGLRIRLVSHENRFHRDWSAPPLRTESQSHCVHSLASLLAERSVGVAPSCGVVFEGGGCMVFVFVCLFVCLFVCARDSTRTACLRASI
jgi:hypothetical protein